MSGNAKRLLPYALAFFTSLCIMVLELVAGRLVARHVGSSLVVWNSVIGIMLGGICLGNVFGGRLADRIEPSRAVGPLYALGAALTLGCLWLNSLGGLIPDVAAIPWLRTVLVVTLDFLVPGTFLGMIGPVVAKLAVEQGKKTGSAIGDVYTMGAVGSILGTFLAGFVLLYYAPVSVVVTLVAAALATIAGVLIGGRWGIVLGLSTGLLLGLGSVPPLIRSLGVIGGGFTTGGIRLNALMLAGHAVALGLAVLGILRLVEARRSAIAAEPKGVAETAESTPGSLRDLAVLSFIASLSFMAFEMAASRLVSHRLGSSIYGWTSIIGVLLAGLSVGNFLGGKLANRITRGQGASWLFVAASACVLTVLLMESPPRWLVWNPFGYASGKPPEPILSGGNPALTLAIDMTDLHVGSVVLIKNFRWWSRVLFVVTLMFFLPSVAMGTMSPVIAKLAVDRLRASKRTGSAIGQVYAWGMVGSILGTFATGFFLIDAVGTKGVLLLIATLLAFSATALGSIGHAAWAGIPLGLCVIAFAPLEGLEKQGIAWGIREKRGDPTTKLDTQAWIDESNYYFIKVDNEPDAEGMKRTIVLDNLIHGYYILGHPERLDYSYEHIYALLSHRVAEAKRRAEGKPNVGNVALETLFFGGGAYTFPRYLQSQYKGTKADVAEIDPAITKANKIALGLGDLPSDADIATTWGDARAFVERSQGKKKYDLIFGDAFNDFSVPWHLTTREFNDQVAGMLTENGAYMINIIDAYESDASVIERSDLAIQKLPDATEAQKEQIRAAERKRAESFSGFLGSWVETAKLSFKHVAIFGTDDEPGSGVRETFVVVASNAPIDLASLGGRDDDPRFFSHDRLFEPKPYGPEHLAPIAKRSRGIILTDDYAPVENLLAPVAETRGKDEED